MQKRTIEIRGMNCDHCVMAVRKELERIAGLTVLQVRIGEAEVAFDPVSIPPERIEAAIAQAGFTVVR
jgi:copper chaperone